MSLRCQSFLRRQKDKKDASGCLVLSIKTASASRRMLRKEAGVPDKYDDFRYNDSAKSYGPGLKEKRKMAFSSIFFFSVRKVVSHADRKMFFCFWACSTPKRTRSTKPNWIRCRPALSERERLFFLVQKFPLSSCLLITTLLSRLEKQILFVSGFVTNFHGVSFSFLFLCLGANHSRARYKQTRLAPDALTARHSYFDPW